MDIVKPWYLSRTVWASLVTILAAAGSLLGLPLSEADGNALVDLLLQAITVLSGLVALFGRVRATSRIG